jgi:outer membrane protein assembly factor BamD
MGRGQRLYQEQKYDKAARDFREVVFNYSGTRVASEAAFLLAECSYNLRDYETAVDDYLQLLGDYPTGGHGDEAQIRLAESYLRQAPNFALDQSETGEKAQAAIDKYFEKYPESKLAERAKAVRIEIQEKLARKDFEAARFYAKRKLYLSAKIYCEGIIREYPDTKWAPQARALLATLPAIWTKSAFNPVTPDSATAHPPADTSRTPAAGDTTAAKSPWK